MSRSAFQRIKAALFGLALLAGWSNNALAQNLSEPEAFLLASQGKLTLIDVRTPEEWRQTGIPLGAKRANLNNPDGDAGFITDILVAVNKDKSKEIGLVCHSGNRSYRAQQLLLANGFTRVFNLDEGMAGNRNGPGWLKRGLPIEDCSSCQSGSSLR